MRNTATGLDPSTSPPPCTVLTWPIGGEWGEARRGREGLANRLASCCRLGGSTTQTEVATLKPTSSR